MSKEDFVDINKYGIKLIIYNFYIKLEKERWKQMLRSKKKSSILRFDNQWEIIYLNPDWCTIFCQTLSAVRWNGV